MEAGTEVDVEEADVLDNVAGGDEFAGAPSAASTEGEDVEGDGGGDWEALGDFVADALAVADAVAVAELTIGHLVNLDRRISDNVAALRARTWDKKTFGVARGLRGRTLAVLGTGQIGREVIQRAKAFEMKI